MKENCFSALAVLTNFSSNTFWGFRVGSSLKFPTRILKEKLKNHPRSLTFSCSLCMIDGLSEDSSCVAFISHLSAFDGLLTVIIRFDTAPRFSWIRIKFLLLLFQPKEHQHWDGMKKKCFVIHKFMYFNARFYLVFIAETIQ